MSGTGFGRGVRRDAVARVVAGESASAVARDLGCCRGSVSLWCQEVGVELVGGRRGGTVQCDQARRAKVVQAVLAGATLTRAGAAAGVSREAREAVLARSGRGECSNGTKALVGALVGA